MRRIGNIGAVQSEAGTVTLRALQILDRRMALIDETVAKVIKNNRIVASHADLQDLSFGASGHTGFASSASLSAHTGDSTIHFTEASIDHANILNIGTNTHAQIDTHIASTSNPHTVTLEQAATAGGTITTATTFSSNSLFVKNRVSRVLDAEYGGYPSDPMNPLNFVAYNVENIEAASVEYSRAAFQFWFQTEQANTCDASLALFDMGSTPIPSVVTNASIFFVDTTGDAYKGRVI